MIKLPDDFSEIRINKAKLWIERVMLDKPGMKEAKTCAAMLEFVAEVQRLNATAQPVSDEHAKIADALESLLWPNMASANKDIISAAIQALRAKSAQPVSDGCKVPEGWKLVPIAPTDKMINAALGIGGFTIRSAYTSMISVAPAAPGGKDA